MLWPEQIIQMKRMLAEIGEPLGIPAVDQAAAALKIVIEAQGPLPAEPKTADEFVEDIWHSTAAERRGVNGVR